MIGSGVAYHAEQAAEKSLKGFLEACGVSFPKTRDLERILKLCETIEPTFQQFTTATQTLTQYATEFRYPGSRAEPPDTEAKTAFQQATDILQFVRGALANTGSSSST